MVEGIKSLSQCEKCKALECTIDSLEQTIDYEREQKEYFQSLLLKRTGDVRNEVLADTNTDAVEYATVERARTPSAMRAKAEQYYRERRAKLDAVPATLKDLTEAERIFEASLKGENGPVQ